MTNKGDKIFISLTYSPRAQTLKRKFGNLPVRYMRVRIEDDEEFKILEKVVKRYQFNLLDEESDTLYQQQHQQQPRITGKRKLYLKPPVIDEVDKDEEDDEDDDDDGNENASEKNYTQTNVVTLPSTSTSSASTSKSKRRVPFTDPDQSIEDILTQSLLDM